ncbi:MAG: hypothetical protein RMJ05_05170 [Thermomicrobium sp.]|nr:hypothetical protein [Thermomicrobium sp.]MDW8006091.1 hypothetical protein [Thermomicrobium sp.]
MGVRTIRSELVRAFARIHPLVRLFVFHPNRGKSYVVRTGVNAARGYPIMFIDADLPVPITVVGQHHPDSALVAPPPWARRVTSRVATRFACWRVVGAFSDTQYGAKAFRAGVARALFMQQRTDRFSFDAEVIPLAVRRLSDKEVPVMRRRVRSHRYAMRC